jgi:serine/threonine-protein kinase RsbW
MFAVAPFRHADMTTTSALQTVPATTEQIPNVNLSLSNRPENVLILRETLAGVAEAIGLDNVDLDDIKTAVTEAANNVVLHAYGGQEGPLEVEVYAAADSVEVLVRDHGRGIDQQAAESADGLGMVVITALARSVSYFDTPGGGTEVCMNFAVDPVHRLRALTDSDRISQPLLAALDASATAIAIAPPSLTSTVLPRLLSVLAARAHFSVDRICDAQLLADALVANLQHGSEAEQRLTVRVSVRPRDLLLYVGPLATGRAQRMLLDSTLVGVGPVIQMLTDQHQVAFVKTGEMLSLRLYDKL